MSIIEKMLESKVFDFGTAYKGKLMNVGCRVLDFEDKVILLISIPMSKNQYKNTKKIDLANKINEMFKNHYEYCLDDLKPAETWFRYNLAAKCCEYTYFIEKGE